MSVRDIKNQLADGRAKIQALRVELKATAKRVFAETSKELFDAWPDLKSFGWTQYTPYFNDGEECVFDAHVEYPTINDEEEFDWERKNPMANAVKAFLAQFENEDYKHLFGDHVQVTVTRKGTEVDSYEHD